MNSDPHLSPRVIADWKSRQLSAAALRAADTHLARCTLCQDRLAIEALTSRTFAALRTGIAPNPGDPSEHPVHEDLSGYLDGELDEVDREILEGHLEGCPECAAELRGLRSFRGVMSSYPAREFQPSPAPGFLARLAQRLPTPAWIALAAGTVVAAAALVISLGHSGGGSSVALLDGGGKIVLTAAGEVTGLPPVSADLAGSIREALRTRQLPAAQVLREVTAPARPRKPFTVTAPSGTVVASAQPSFSWRLPAEAIGCKVVLASLHGGKPFESKMLKADHWRPGKPLRPGEVYRWQVVAYNADGGVVASSPEQPDSARFKVLDAAGAAEVALARPACGGSHLALGVLYASQGLLDDAEQEFAALHRENPESAVAGDLVRSVRTLHRHTAPAAT